MLDLSDNIIIKSIWMDLMTDIQLLAGWLNEPITMCSFRTGVLHSIEHKSGRNKLRIARIACDIIDENAFIERIDVNADLLLSGIEPVLVGRIAKSFHEMKYYNVFINKNVDISSSVFMNLNFKLTENNYYFVNTKKY